MHKCFQCHLFSLLWFWMISFIIILIQYCTWDGKRGVNVSFCHHPCTASHANTKLQQWQRGRHFLCDGIEQTLFTLFTTVIERLSQQWARIDNKKNQVYGSHNTRQMSPITSPCDKPPPANPHKSNTRMGTLLISHVSTEPERSTVLKGNYGLAG